MPAEQAWLRERQLLAGQPMSQPLLLDEMFSDDIAERLRAMGHDVISIVTDPALAGLLDELVLAYAATARRALVTAAGHSRI